jgi:nucleoside-diphosphate-sugar epimerase
VTDPKLSVAVTGASGFVGQALVGALAANPGYSGRGLYRSAPSAIIDGIQGFTVGDLSETTEFGEALRGVDVVVHTAARTHVLDDREPHPLAAYRRINLTGTLNLARAAVAAGVKRLVFLSSIKVNGESTPIDRPFTEADEPLPLDAYGQTKWEAEQALWTLSAETGLEVVVLRPPLIYGPGVKGNLRRLIRLVERGVPLPLGAVHNRRSMIALDNLVSALLVASTHLAAAGETFLVSDQHDLSTVDLLQQISAGLGRRSALWPVPVGLLRQLGTLAGRQAEFNRLTGSLQVDSSKLSEQLGWRPGVSVAESIRRMVER